jgi:aryl-alcohol dehydrogenase-like predicted oxidoreductase
VVARALAEIPQSSRPLVFTKCSLIWDEKGNISHSLAPDSMRRELESSLRRLRVDTIDLYQIHWANFPGQPPNDAGIEDAWRMLARLQQGGKIRHIGVSNFNVPQMERIRAIAPVSSLQPPYSMLMRRRNRASDVLRGAGDRRDCLFPHARRSAQRNHDP